MTQPQFNHYLRNWRGLSLSSSNRSIQMKEKCGCGWTASPFFTFLSWPSIERKERKRERDARVWVIRLFLFKERLLQKKEIETRLIHLMSDLHVETTLKRVLVSTVNSPGHVVPLSLSFSCLHNSSKKDHELWGHEIEGVLGHRLTGG